MKFLSGMSLSDHLFQPLAEFVPGNGQVVVREGAQGIDGKRDDGDLKGVLLIAGG